MKRHLYVKKVDITLTMMSCVSTLHYSPLKTKEVISKIIETFPKLLLEVQEDSSIPKEEWLCSIPLSTQSLEKFGANAEQVSSGLSIIVRVEGDKCIYKYNWDGEEHSKMFAHVEKGRKKFALMGSHAKVPRREKQFLLPTDQEETSGNFFQLFNQQDEPRFPFTAADFTKN